MTTVNGLNFSPYNTDSSAETKNDKQTLMQNDFLKLLTTQLKNQDPLSPVDDSQFLAQMAQFSALEQMSNVAQSVRELNNNMTWLASQSLLTQGAAMIGKEAVAIGEDGSQVSGTISSIRVDGNSLKVLIGEEAVNIENILEIKQAAEGSNTTSANEAATDTTSTGGDSTNETDV